MEWGLQRKEMDKALKSKVIPLLKEKGFTGSYPHLRRFNSNSIDVWGFQFSQWGPQFYIEIGISPVTGTTFGDNHYPPEKIKYYQCIRRIRIGDNPYNYQDDGFEILINKVIECLPDAENWWSNTSI
jgi:hypothetical protein